MLVLSRKTGERIHIGDEIVVEIRRIAGNRVTLAMRAPRNVRVSARDDNPYAREKANLNAAPLVRPEGLHDVPWGPPIKPSATVYP